MAAKRRISEREGRYIEPQARADSGTPAPAKRGWYATSGKPPRLGIGSATVEPFRQRQQIDAIKLALADRPRDLTLFVVGIHFGLRGSDLLALRHCDVFSATGRIHDFISVVERKTGKLRRIAVQPSVRCALTALWRKQLPSDRSGYVFQSRKGGRLQIARLHQLVKAWATEVGVPGNYGSHSLRKTFGYQLRQVGVGIETIMKIFGHTSQAITLRYLGIDQDETDEARLRLNL